MITESGADAANVPEHNPEVDSLLSTLRIEGKRRKPLIRRSAGLLGMCLFSLLLLLFLLIVAFEMSLHRPVTRFIPGALILAASILGLHSFTGSPRQLRAARRLVEIADSRAIGALTDIMSWHDKSLGDQAQKLLTVLLPRMEAIDAKLLTRYQYFQLTQSLNLYNVDSRSEYVLSVLLALERIGDARAAPFVRALTMMTANSNARLGVKEAAVRCLYAIDSRRAVVPARVISASAAGETPPDDNPARYIVRRPKRPARRSVSHSAEQQDMVVRPSGPGDTDSDHSD